MLSRPLTDEDFTPKDDPFAIVDLGARKKFFLKTDTWGLWDAVYLLFVKPEHLIYARLLTNIQPINGMTPAVLYHHAVNAIDAGKLSGISRELQDTRSTYEGIPVEHEMTPSLAAKLRLKPIGWIPDNTWHFRVTDRVGFLAWAREVHGILTPEWLESLLPEEPHPAAREPHGNALNAEDFLTNLINAANSILENERLAPGQKSDLRTAHGVPKSNRVAQTVHKRWEELTGLGYVKGTPRTERKLTELLRRCDTLQVAGRYWYSTPLKKDKKTP